MAESPWGVVVAHDVADDLGGLGVLLVELEAHLLHAVEDAAVDGLEAVADIGQGAADDDRHGVVEVGPAHLVFDIDGEMRLRAPGPVIEGPSGGGACGRWIVAGGILGRGRGGIVGSEREIALIVCHGYLH